MINQSIKGDLRLQVTIKLYNIITNETKVVTVREGNVVKFTCYPDKNTPNDKQKVLVGRIDSIKATLPSNYSNVLMDYNNLTDISFTVDCSLQYKSSVEIVRLSDICDCDLIPIEESTDEQPSEPAVDEKKEEESSSLTDKKEEEIESEKPEDNGEGVEEPVDQDINDLQETESSETENDSE